MAVLTDQQLELLVEKRKTTLPLYYNTEVQDTTPISSDTEDALILLNAAAKQKATAYLKAVERSTSSTQAKDYNDLLEEVVTQQEKNSEAASQEMDAVMSKFNDFRSKLSSDLASAGTIVEAGMEPVLSAMTKSMGRVVEIQNMEFFHKTFDSFLLGVFKQEANENRKKELRAWVRVIASYP